MITGHHKHTAPLDQDELQFVPHMIKGFKKYTKKNPIKASEIVRLVNENRNQFGFAKKLTEVRLRKIVNYIRTKGLHPVMSSSAGYYTSYDPNDIKDQIQSMQERASAINSAANGLNNYLIKNSYQTA